MLLDRDRKKGPVVLRVHGELDLVNAPSLAVDAADAIRSGEDLIVDFSRLSFIDSAGLAMLLNACRRATRAGVGFQVVCPPGAARRSMQISRLEETLNVCDSEREARRRLAKR